ncbi:hypothetical protein D9M68_809590 [compost metagenome]
MGPGQALAQVDGQGHLVGVFLVLALHAVLHRHLLAFGEFAQSGHVAFAHVHMPLGAFDELHALAQHAALKVQRVVDLGHELAVVHQQRHVDTDAAASTPALLGLLGIGLQLVHLVLCLKQLALHLAQRTQRLVAALLGDFNDLVERLDRGHACLPS